MLKTQQRFLTEKHNVFTEAINKIALSSNDGKRLQSVDLIDTYGYRRSKYVVSAKEVIKSNNNKTIQKMINFDVTKENIKEHNSNWSHPYRILMIGGSGSGKANSFFNLKNQQPVTDKIYLYAKDSFEVKYQFLINKWESTGLKHFNAETFIEYSNDMDVEYKNIEEYNPNEKHKILFLMIWLLICLLISIRKLNTSIVFITQSYVYVPKILD